MREINVSEVEELVRDLCIKANLYLPEDMESCIECNARKEQEKKLSLSVRTQAWQLSS